MAKAVEQSGASSQGVEFEADGEAVGKEDSDAFFAAEAAGGNRLIIATHSFHPANPHETRRILREGQLQLDVHSAGGTQLPHRVLHLRL